MSAMSTWLASVRGRITVGVTIVFGLAMALGGWFLLDRAKNAWIQDIEAADLTELEELAESLQAYEAVPGGMAIGYREIPLPVGIDGTVYELRDATGALVAATPPAIYSSSVIVEDLSQLGDVTVEYFEPGSGLVPGSDIAFATGIIGDATSVSVPVEFGQGVFTLVATSPLAPVQAGVDTLRNLLFLIVPVLVAGVGGLTWMVTGRTFLPVAAITNQVERISDDRLDERVPVPQSRDEVAHLAKTMNTMLDRLQSSRRRQRQFVSDASHELRNPVATSKVKLEIALAHPKATDWEDTARVVLEEQNRLGGLVDDLLLLARIDEDQPTRREPVDLDDIVFAEAARPGRHPIDVTHVEASQVAGDPKQLSRLVRNLIDNASRYAKSTVAVALASSGDESILTIDDDGLGIPKKDRARIFKRFVRLEDARTRDQGGAGLGLALVHAVVAAHNGSVQVSESPLGGARFRVRLPHSPAENVDPPTN